MLELTLYKNYSTPFNFLDVQPYVLLFVIFTGLPREPQWGHLRDLHDALKLCQKALLWGTPSVQTLGKDLEVDQK